MGEDICSNPSDKYTCSECEAYGKNNSRAKKSPDCPCKRCKWFGCTDRGGIVAVLDAEVLGAETENLRRIQLCEHSMQNVNMFLEEYLKKGTFNIEILIDCSRDGSVPEELISEIECVLNEMKADSAAPPGWHRLGASSTCTGQVCVASWQLKEFRSSEG